ncbi:GAF domain-containing protein [Streptomyces sp. SID685]|uniref:GAF domain-containing protein n=1 Tax=Streptomyces sp. SID685 TaxID=2690322 RepID=UPI0031FEB194
MTTRQSHRLRSVRSLDTPAGTVDLHYANLGALPRERSQIKAGSIRPKPTVRRGNAGFRRRRGAMHGGRRADPRSVGFPPCHPRMTTLLGVPLTVRGTVYGNLYLADKTDGTPFTDDEAILTALASAASVSIENARLYQDLKRVAMHFQLRMLLDLSPLRCELRYEAASELPRLGGDAYLLRWSHAGDPPPLLHPGLGARFLSPACHGIPVGVDPTVPRYDHAQRLAAGSTRPAGAVVRRARHGARPAVRRRCHPARPARAGPPSAVRHPVVRSCGSGGLVRTSGPVTGP